MKTTGQTFEQKVSKKVQVVVNKTRQLATPLKKTYQVSSRPKPKQATSSAIISTFNTGNTRSSQSSNRPVGRPRNVYVHRSPFNGKPIPAPQYYKEVRLFKRQQQVFAQRNYEARLAQLAKQGISPQQAQQIQQMRMQQQTMPQPMPQQQVQQIQQRPVQNHYARQVPQNNVQIQPRRTIWKDNRYIDNDWGLFGPRQVVRGGPESFWN